MKLYKLTKTDGTTYNGTNWSVGITHRVAKREKEPRLCSQDVIHAYRNPNLALLLNPIHGNHYPPCLWEASGRVAAEDWGKVGCYVLTIKTQLEMPAWYADEKKRKRVQILFAIMCAEVVLNHYESKYPKDKRPTKAIEAARTYLKDPSQKNVDAAYAAAEAAGRAADAAAHAADAAAYAAADAAAYAAAYAADAADAAAYAAYAARAAQIDFSGLADKAVETIMAEDESNGK